MAFNHYKLAARAVHAFKAAEKMGETLAAANLADALISAGFLDEARDWCVDAQKAEHPHRNVNAALARLEDTPESETKRLATITRDAQQTADFYKELGEAICCPDIHKIDSSWTAPECEYSVTLANKRFKAVGSYEQRGGIGLFAAASPPDHITVEYSGTIKGHSIRGKVWRKSQNSGLPLGTLMNEPAFHMLIADGGKKLKIMEGQGNARRFYEWSLRDDIASS